MPRQIRTSCIPSRRKAPPTFQTDPIMFELTHEPISPDALRVRLDAAETGALTVFEGRVRNHHLGRPVTKLEYEAFDEMALREGDAITSETEALYPGAQVLCVHRTGTL